MPGDTIFALSSGAGAAGVAVIRLSGPAAFDSATKLCGSLPEPRIATLRTLRDPESGEAIDSGIVLVFPKPASFTGEDCVEFQVHGSLAVVRWLSGVLRAHCGLRAAEAGEFTHRAFENGKLDLLQVEALGDLLAAETAAQARLAAVVQRRLHIAALDWREQLICAIALTEAYIDFSDESDVTATIDSETEQGLAKLRSEIGSAVGTFARSERIRRGLRVAVMGPPNAGKSTLVNALASRDVAITSPVPGTTRDAIEVHLDLDGYPVILVDTAGIRETSDVVERIGVSRATTTGAEADLVLWLSPEGEMPTNLLNETVLIRSRSDEFDSDPTQSWMRVSSASGQGLHDLTNLLVERAKAAMSGAEHVVVAHERQRSALDRAVEALDRALGCQGCALELRAEELRYAARALDRLVGRIDHEAVLGEIFSRFCVGK